MDPIKYTFKNSGNKKLNDVFYPGPAFDLRNFSYTFRILPKTAYWRFGILFSDSQKIPQEAFDKSFRFLHKYIFFSTGNTDGNGKWNPANTMQFDLSLNNYGPSGSIPIDPKKEFEISLQYNEEENLLEIMYGPEKSMAFGKMHMDKSTHFQLFAWAEWMDFELDCTIESYPDICAGLIRDNIKQRSKTLDLSNCGMKEIPQNITELDWLEELIISAGSYYDYIKKERFTSSNNGKQNNFSHLPKGLGNLKNLKTLVLMGHKSNPINEIDLSEIAALTNLEFLCILHSPLSDIRALSGLVKLTQLYLYDNGIGDLTPLSNLKELKVLRFRNNKVTSIAPLSNLRNLQVLRFGRNNVSDISPLARLFQLENLSFYSNEVSDLSPLSRLILLEKLSFRENKVTDISPLVFMVNLEELDFRSNMVSNISPLGELTGLKKLYFRKNEVADLSPIANHSSLKELDFGFNRVYDISPIANIRNLQIAKFQGCPVKWLAPLAELAELKEYSCEGCPIEDYPTDVYETGDPQQLRAYSKGQSTSEAITRNPMALEKDLKISKPIRLKKGQVRDNGTDQKRDVKLIILGNSNTGKTNLVNFLQTQKYIGSRKTTHGLEVHRWLPDEKTFPTLKDIAVSIWDFGGQEYYHESYRLFLSSNTVYLLLWTLESDINGRRKTCVQDGHPEVELEHFEIRYWLDTIRFYSGGKTGAPLLAVQNKTDEPENKKRIAQELHDKFNIRESYHISLQKGGDKTNPRQHNVLNGFLSELEYIIESNADKATIPIHWQHIRNKILSLKNGGKGTNEFSAHLQHDLWISIPDFNKACATITKGQISPEEEYTIPRWLDRGGVVVYFPKIDSLKDKLFLLPDKLAQKIYEVLNENVLARGGEFSTEDILPGADPAFRQVFLEIASNLELIFPHPIKGEDHYLAPQYLPEKHAIEDLFRIASKDAWLSAFWIRIPLFYYKKVLHGLLIHFAADKNARCPYFWKNGILFIKNELRVLIKGLYPNEDEHEGSILISVEKDATRQQALQKEIFNKLLSIIESSSEAVPYGDLGPAEELQLLAQLAEDINLQVSYDGIHYVAYSDLLDNYTDPKIIASDEKTWLLMKNFAPILPFAPPRAKKVFLSYSHQNASWLSRLRTHLAGLRRSKEIETWDDKELLPGELWDDSIRKNLEEADVYILLLSADFIASDYIWNEELTTAFQKFKDRNALVIPILFEPLDLGSIPSISINDREQSISGFEIIPKNDTEQLRAVSLWPNQEEALARVAQRIRQAIQKA